MITGVKYVKLPNLRNVSDGKPVARRALAWLMTNPEQHDQNSWTGARQYDGDSHEDVTMAEDGKSLHCGTTCCIGGLIALGSGWTWNEVANGRIIGYDPFGVPIHEGVEYFAARRLGLDYDEAYGLFHDMREANALRKLAAIANGTYDINGPR